MKKTINESFYLTNSFIENYKTNLFKSQNHEHFPNCDAKIGRFPVCANSSTKKHMFYNIILNLSAIIHSRNYLWTDLKSSVNVFMNAIRSASSFRVKSICPFTKKTYFCFAIIDKTEICFSYQQTNKIFYFLYQSVFFLPPDSTQLINLGNVSYIFTPSAFERTVKSITGKFIP